MSKHVLYTANDFKNLILEEMDNDILYRNVVDGGLQVCKVCGEFEAGLDNPCKLKKRFLVEIEYNELERNKNAHVLYDTGIEIMIENMMEGYLECESIEKEYSVNATEIE